MTLDTQTSAMCPVCDTLVSLHDVNAYEEFGGQFYHVRCAKADEDVAGTIQPDARDEQIADLTKKLAASERALERMTRVAAGSNDTIKFLRDKLSLASPAAEQQFARIAKELERLGALEKRVEQIASELFSGEPSMASAQEMVDGCGFDCSCPSLLHHRVSALRSELEVRAFQTTVIMNRLDEMLDESRGIDR